MNGSTVHDEPQTPFGGVKSSGWGRVRGEGGAGGVYGVAVDYDSEDSDSIIRFRWPVAAGA